jgi:hypothetical protein
MNHRRWRQLVTMIRDGDQSVKFVKTQLCRVSLWDVVVLNQQCRVVYDNKRNNIVTVLPDQPFLLSVQNSAADFADYAD